MLNTRLRKRLINRATANAFHRRLSYEEIAQLEGIRACRRTLTAAFEKEQYHRRVAVEKPLLTEAHKRARLQWAYDHLNWTPAMWARVFWTRVGNK
jgi:methylphosphotriester-DNA--protein-cysteine methyltransferase